VFTVYSQSCLPAALLCLLAGIPRRLAHCRENPYLLLTDWVPESEPERQVRHEVLRQVELVATVGARCADRRPSLRVPADALERVDRLLGARSLGRDGWIAIHPGASAPSRRYAPERFAAVADGLAAAGVRAVFVGGEDERPLVDGIRAAMRAPSHSVAGETDLPALAALLARAPLLLANNSGPAHIEAAVGTPVVSLYALTNPQHTPWGVPHRVRNGAVPCACCYKSTCPMGHHDCLRIPPDEVVRAALELLAETARNPGAERDAAASSRAGSARPARSARSTRTARA
jgi:ADP-heptose:LPS heptosyltransferase